MTHYPKAHAILFTLAALAALPCLAGRPLSVDDASVNDSGAGHVESWFTQQSGGRPTLTVAPAYGLADGIEIGVAVTRGSGDVPSTNAAQAKFQWTPSLARGCNVGTTVGAVQYDSVEGNSGSADSLAPFVNGLLSCNADWGSVHMNAGATRPLGSETLATWGIAVERGFGAWTAHLESFGQAGVSPALQVGLRTQISKGVQADATAGRVNGDTVLSLGMKFQF